MTAPPLELLLFRDGGVRFAVDRRQVRAAQDLGKSAFEHLPHFLEALGCDRGTPGTGSPIVLSLRTEPPSWILVDAVESITEIPLGDIRPLPRLAESSIRDKGLWAALLLEDELVLLADFDRLPIPVQSSAS
jgi:hypothetical protein